MFTSRSKASEPLSSIRPQNAATPGQQSGHAAGTLPLLRMGHFFAMKCGRGGQPETWWPPWSIRSPISLMPYSYFDLGQPIRLPYVEHSSVISYFDLSFKNCPFLKRCGSQARNARCGVAAPRHEAAVGFINDLLYRVYELFM